MTLLTIRRLFDIVNGGTPSRNERYWNGSIPWATPVDLSKYNGIRLRSTQRTLTSQGLEAGSSSVPAGSLIISTRAPIGYVTESTMDVAFNQGCRGLVPKLELDVRFFRYQLSAMREELQALGQGSTFMELSGEGLAATRVHVPPLPSQRAIANRLDTISARIKALIGEKRRMIELLNERIQAQYDSWFATLASTYGLLSIRRWSSGIEQGWSPVCDSEPAGLGESGVIKTSAVSSGQFVATNNKRLPSEIECDTRWLLHDGDLLVTRGSGSRSMAGRACVAYVGKQSLTLSDLVYRVRLIQANSEFVAAALVSSPARAQIESSIRTDVGQTLKIRRDDLAHVRVPAVPFDFQMAEVAKLTDRLSPQHAAMRMISRQIELLAERKLALISVLVSGKMSVPGTSP